MMPEKRTRGFIILYERVIMGLEHISSLAAMFSWLNSLVSSDPATDEAASSSSAPNQQTTAPTTESSDAATTQEGTNQVGVVIAFHLKAPSLQSFNTGMIGTGSDRSQQASEERPADPPAVPADVCEV
jgi:hypothetical protein